MPNGIWLWQLSSHKGRYHGTSSWDWQHTTLLLGHCSFWKYKLCADLTKLYPFQQEVVMDCKTRRPCQSSSTCLIIFSYYHFLFYLVFSTFKIKQITHCNFKVISTTLPFASTLKIWTKNCLRWTLLSSNKKTQLISLCNIVFRSHETARADNSKVISRRCHFIGKIYFFLSFCIAYTASSERSRVKLCYYSGALKDLKLYWAQKRKWSQTIRSSS